MSCFLGAAPPRTELSKAGAAARSGVDSRRLRPTLSARAPQGPVTLTPSQTDHQVEDLPDAFAAIDLGTQTALLLIAVPRPNGSLEVVEDHAFSARLGQGLEAGGKLLPEAADRTIEILATFARRLELRGVEPPRVRAAGTAVLRRASDGQAFLERVQKELGIALEILSGDEEARVGHAAAIEALPEAERDGAVVVDVGGGSSEVVLGAGSRRHSLPLGALLATDRFSQANLISEIERVAAELPSAAAEGRSGVFLGGAASNLACLERKLESYDPRLAEGAWVTGAAGLDWARRLLDLETDRRRDLPIEPDRADILPAGLALLGAISARIGLEGAVVTGRGLRYGLLRELVAGAGKAGSRGLD